LLFFIGAAFLHHLPVSTSEKEAISYAIENAKPGALITICSDVVPDALKQVQEYKESEADKLYEFSTDDIPNMG